MADFSLDRKKVKANERRHSCERRSSSQSQKHGCGHSAQRTGSDLRSFRLRQVLFSFRRPLCRRIAPLLRSAVCLHAPSSMLSDSSGTRLARLTVTAIPVPPQVGQAPELLKEKSSALGASNSTPQTGHLSFCPSATAGVGGK